MNYYIISSSKLSSSSSLNYITENEGLSLYHEATEVFHIKMLFTGREVRIGKNCARGLEYVRPRAVLETEGTVFPSTDRPRPVNNIFTYF